MTLDVSDAPSVLGPGESTPPRRAGSVRRTSTIDMTWPGGWGTPMTLVGRARDLLTPTDGAAPTVLAEDVVHATVAPDRTITAIRSDPPRPALSGLVGARGGGRLRGALVEVVPDERTAGTPLYLLLDDLAGATLVGGFAYSQWPDEWPEDWKERRGRATTGRRMDGVCIGFRPGSSALNSDGSSSWTHDIRAVRPLGDPADPQGWHRLDDITAVSMRRARRIDVRLDADGIDVDAFFQDSATVPAGGRVAVHEYQLKARVDAASGRLVSAAAVPRVLPYAECPLAVLNIDRMIGTPMHELREQVLEELRGTAGCTHLNDMLRALAEVPLLAQALAP
jgi:hypothetical protein